MIKLRKKDVISTGIIFVMEVLFFGATLPSPVIIHLWCSWQSGFLVLTLVLRTTWSIKILVRQTKEERSGIRDNTWMHSFVDSSSLVFKSSVIEFDSSVSSLSPRPKSFVLTLSLSFKWVLEVSSIFITKRSEKLSAVFHNPCSHTEQHSRDWYRVGVLFPGHYSKVTNRPWFCISTPKSVWDCSQLERLGTKTSVWSQSSLSGLINT